MSTWVFGDVHGAYKALVQIFERAKIKKGDTIISLGDICDGWSEVFECVELLTSMQKDYNMIFCKGNHDDWFNTFIKRNRHPQGWLQGGDGTLKSYCKNLSKEFVLTDNSFFTNLLESDIPESHRNFFNKQLNYYKDDNGNIFVHGGFNRHFLLRNQFDDSIFYWDRDLWSSAMSHTQIDAPFKIKEECKNVFIGHTTTMMWKSDRPIRAGKKIWNLDTGAGFNGKLTIMDVDTHEYYQSDNVQNLYPNERGRNG